jgi:hypothetical protein
LSALRTGNDGFNDIVRVFDLAKLGVPQGRSGVFSGFRICGWVLGAILVAAVAGLTEG